MNDNDVIHIENKGFDAISFVGLCEYLRVVNITALCKKNEHINNTKEGEAKPLSEDAQ